MLDLQMFEMRGMRLVGIVVGLSLLCVNAWAMPAAGSDRKLEAYAAWGMLPACLPTRRQPVVPETRSQVFVSAQTGGEVAPVASTSVASTPVATSSAAGVSDRERRLKKRLLAVAVLAGVVLLLLAVVYGYFRLELTTRGFYSGRLQVVSGIASLAVVTAAYFLWWWLAG